MAYALYEIAQISQIHLFFDSVLSLQIKLYSFIYRIRIKPKIHLASDFYEHFVSVFCPVLFSFFFYNSSLLIDDGRWPSVVAKHCELELEGLRVYRVRPGRRQRHFDTLANGFYGAIKFVICSVRFQFFGPCFT